MEPLDVHASASASAPETLRTSIGDFTLEEYRLGLGGRTWSILHTGAVLTWEDEQRYLGDAPARLPYGVALWPASIALARGRRRPARPGA